MSPKPRGKRNCTGLWKQRQLLTISERVRIRSLKPKGVSNAVVFIIDALNYQKQLFGQTLFFRIPASKEIVCAFTLSNDSIKVSDLPGSVARRVKKGIPHSKSIKSYPATLIGRFGVPTKYQGKNIGSQVMNFIKSICITEDANKCRFILGDAYNKPDALGFYSKNDFKCLFSNEEQEKNHYKKPKESSLNTRFMYFDLLDWVEKIEQQ